MGDGERKKENGAAQWFEEIMAENFWNLRADININIQIAQWNSKTNSKKPTLRHIKIELSKEKDQEGTLKAAREKQRGSLTICADYS